MQPFEIFETGFGDEQFRILQLVSAVRSEGKGLGGPTDTGREGATGRQQSSRSVEDWAS